MVRNFDEAIFSNGDSIPNARSTEEWQKAGEAAKPAWCYYQNDTSLGRKYGRIYNWYAISDPLGFGPEGWHVPTNEEWIILENFLGNSVAGLRLKCNGEINDNSKGNHTGNILCTSWRLSWQRGRFFGY